MGTRRTGDFYDTYEDTPEVKVALERSDEGISLTVAWSGPEVPYAAWFMKGESVWGLSGPPPEPKPVPKRVLFHDSYGTVLLIRCWARGYHANFGGPGSGTLWARAAIMGVGEDKEFDRPQGLQTEISGLREWMGVTSWEKQPIPGDGPPNVILSSLETSTLKAGEHAGMTLDFRSGWSVLPDEGNDRRVLLDLLRCTTRSIEPLEWDVHMQLHRAIRDLLVVSRWRDESCVPVRVLREDDPMTTMDGQTHGDLWREVVVADDERKPASKGHHPHLVQYQDLGVEGIGRWVSLREKFARALDPVITSIDLRKTTPQTLLAHTGPGVEALGYLLMIRDGMEPKRASRATLQSRFERILADLGGCLPFDGVSWARRTVSTYNALKHANRTMPDDADVINAWAESVMVVRAWVALELGIAMEVVKTRLANDRQPRRFEKID
ncbi:HEPN domain-containing protein [Cryobacterium sp. TMT1-21]|uniref:ApeA N-terminal domain 1-containing protein n=1 Tax=Cryobacterium sp. TMT1-21 TaxID=1259234 RepID=UPI00351A38F9